MKAAGAPENSNDTRIIPVVVHVIHNGGSENISNAQIERQIEILNEDYGKLPGTPGDGAGADTRVRFCLAKTAPARTMHRRHRAAGQGDAEKSLVLGQYPLPEYVRGQKHHIDGKVYFIDRSLNSATSWQWFFPGGTPTSSILQNPTVTYDSLGIFSVTLITANSNGSDTLFLENYITVTEPGFGQSLPFSVNFDDGIFPPTGAEIYNPDLGITWELDAAAAHSAPYSARIDNLVNINYGTRDEIVLPFLNLSTSNPDSALLLTFWWAYARSDPNYSDELIVQISKDCGVNYTNILTKSGASLVTGPTQTTPFIPTAAQWKKATVNLFQYKTEQYVKIRFVNVTDGGSWDEPMHIRVFDSLGRLLRDYGADAASTLDLAGLLNGLLFVKIESAGRIAGFLLIKEK